MPKLSETEEPDEKETSTRTASSLPNRVSWGAHLPSEIQEINLIYGRLRDAGLDADQAMVDAPKARNAASMRQLGPWFEYHEPHLDREWFDAERPDREA